MKIPGVLGVLLVMVLAGWGCQKGQESSTTKGVVTIECDESVWPVMQAQGENFASSYPEARVRLRSVEAREAIANFINDSVRVIVSARPFNKEEQDAIASAKVDLQEFKVALEAIAVIANKENPTAELRLTELDSIFAGTLTAWPGRQKRTTIELVIGGINSSTNEVFRDSVLRGRPIAASATPFSSTPRLLEYVRKVPNAIGIAGISWLRGHEGDVTILGLGNPDGRPDTTQPVGKFYRPHQAYIYKKYYPLVRTVYMYTREVQRDVGLGFISYVTSAEGQKVFLNNGLVPVTMPVRIVNLTSEQVK
jgi:phosphate transport system substrate-binding protein